ncbi:hypothetical protein HS088_TW20G00712 [Tripterygium wilfordii]|uniref:Uncharacterized protein n=1 Tax=Tripterygium wilfordii TaxID=458696 RepID=A0A7J7C878_TRIWF|nr:hypothetical protein HS088_TW20G00712 [Tripterygium wilfordii]
MDAKPSTSYSSSASIKKDSKCHHKALEYAVSACLFFISCPLCITWCCIKLPCKIGWRVAKRWTCCCRSQEKIYAAYSSFSDIDSDCLTNKVDREGTVRGHKSADCLKGK